ncbi:hypothetical protein [Geomesophilobacter sediminis]|uniref:Uncharacterized protein n=1 Tax=Geomesophilobacter sediminis TaxID=2798584 RepID=A0A8J7M375_9BACT|nr:hypothetical protein [Geomesophilobacter sediminis]MBJ6727413.1 hypothetical protein [Geomesophilobacter sediminis]
MRRKPHDTRIGMLLALVPALLLVVLAALPAFGAVGCDLNDADRDVPRLFPGATRYQSIYVSIQKKGGAALQHRIEGRLGERHLALYAPIDVPYTIYEIYSGPKKVGYIHGVNQKGQFGGIQVFIAQDLSGKVKTFYIQKMTGPAAAKMRDPRFAKHFVGVTLKDFDSYDPITGKGTGRLAHVPNPAPEMETDFFGVLRGLKKNLVLMDAFIFSGGNP